LALAGTVSFLEAKVKGKGETSYSPRVKQNKRD
jgi:hypothetical protein